MPWSQKSRSWRSGRKKQLFKINNGYGAAPANIPDRHRTLVRGGDRAGSSVSTPSAMTAKPRLCPSVITANAMAASLESVIKSRTKDWSILSLIQWQPFEVGQEE